MVVFPEAGGYTGRWPDGRICGPEPGARRGSDPGRRPAGRPGGGIPLDRAPARLSHLAGRGDSASTFHPSVCPSVFSASGVVLGTRPTFSPSCIVSSFLTSFLSKRRCRRWSRRRGRAGLSSRRAWELTPPPPPRLVQLVQHGAGQGAPAAECGRGRCGRRGGAPAPSLGTKRKPDSSGGFMVRRSRSGSSSVRGCSS